MADLNDLIEKIAAMRLETPSITFKDVEKILREEKGITESSSMMKKAFGKAGRTIGKQKDASEVEAKKQAEADEREQRKRDREQGLPERTTSTAAMSQGPPEYLGFISKFPKHLPHLYPGGPEWTKNPSAYFPPSMMPSVKVALDSSWQQRTMDRRYYFVNEHYSDFGGMQNVKRTCLEHQAIHARFGFLLQFPRHLEQKEMTIPELMERGGTMVVIEKYDDRWMEDAERKCDECKTLTRGRCQCGEYYCSKECQMADWKFHREMCEVVSENQRLLNTLTHIYWMRKIKEDPSLLNLMKRGPRLEEL